MSMLARFAATGGGVATYIEDVFSTFLYTGNGSTQTITNGIDLAGKGGLVWIKQRSVVNNHFLAHAATVRLRSDATNANVTTSDGVTSFNSNGFSIGANANLNGATDGSIVSWTFREQAKFFDVVTYTGDGVAGRTVAHNLGSVPGCMIIKCTSNADDWVVYHRSLGATQYLQLETTLAAATSSTRFNDTAPTSTQFTVGSALSVNGSGRTYVAYLFAHDAGGFGASGSDNVVSCGSFTTAASGYSSISLGYEPQWLLIKTTGVSQNWFVFDNMRGFVVTGNSPSLSPNTSAAEDTSVSNAIRPTATGFDINADYFGGSKAYIYLAIRRGPMKTPTSGTSVFSPVAYTGNGTSYTISGLSNTPDLLMGGRRTGTTFLSFVDRLRGFKQALLPPGSGAELTSASTEDVISMNNNNVVLGTVNNTTFNAAVTDIAWIASRAPGFFDEVCYTGTGSARTLNHNLGAVPELMIVKNRSDATGRAWAVYANNDNTDYLVLNTTAATADDIAYWNDTSPTSSVFTVGTSNSTNESGDTFVAYLFATVAGVSKVFSYTGNGSSQTINCGFTGGARFVLIKRTDSTGDWYVWDSARGIVAGNDPHLSLNSTAAEVTTDDSVDTDSTGFVVNQLAATNVNVNTATYIGLAIA